MGSVMRPPRGLAKAIVRVRPLLNPNSLVPQEPKREMPPASKREQPKSKYLVPPSGPWRRAWGNKRSPERLVPDLVSQLARELGEPPRQ